MANRIEQPSARQDRACPSPAAPGYCTPGTLWGWSPPPLPADTRLKRGIDRFMPRSGLSFLLFFGAVVALLNVGSAVPARAALLSAGAASLAAGGWCTLNFWRCRHAHCVITGTGWLALAGFSFVEAGLGHSLIAGDEGLVFLAVLVAGLAFEGVWYLRRGTNAVTPAHDAMHPLPVLACSLDGAALQDRGDRWRAFLADHLLEGRETQGGVRLMLRASPAGMAELRRLIDLERECCPWMSWSITKGPQVVAEVTAPRPEEVRALRAWLRAGPALADATAGR